jgi:hypothetical protein
VEEKFSQFHLNNSLRRSRILNNILHNSLPESKNYSLMYKSDVVNLQNADIHLQTVPFDSGVIQSNLLSCLTLMKRKSNFTIVVINLWMRKVFWNLINVE